MSIKFGVTFSDVEDFSQVFTNLDGSEIKKLQKYLVHQKYPAHIPICSEGQIGDGIFLINQGAVKVMKKIAGGSKQLGRLEKGDVFGEISFLTKSKFTASVYTETECDITCLPADKFDEIERKDLKLAYKIVLSLTKVLAEKLVTVNQLL